MPLLLAFLLAFACTARPAPTGPAIAAGRDTLPAASPYGRRLSEAALALTRQKVTYDPAYVAMPYPLGDVPPDRGVCSDVVIRAYRQLGVDLQQLVHEDMKANFSAYPTRWGLKRPDTNIDHRRVPNLQVFFQRKNAAQPLTKHAADYLPGDVVTWTLPQGLPHIGIVVDSLNADRTRYQIVHNIGSGQVLEDVLFEYTISGHYRYQR